MSRAIGNCQHIKQGIIISINSWIKNEWLINPQPSIIILHKSSKNVSEFPEVHSGNSHHNMHVRFTLLPSSEHLQAVYTRDIHAELNSFLVLLISEVRNTAITGKLRTFWECNKYQGGYFNSCHFTQKPNVVGIIKTSFLKALNTEVNSKQGSRIWGNGKWMKQTFFLTEKEKYPGKGKATVKLVPNRNRQWKKHLNNLTHKTSQRLPWHDTWNNYHLESFTGISQPARERLVEMILKKQPKTSRVVI